MVARAASLQRARRQKGGPVGGFIVTWDGDSRDGSQVARLRRLVFGYRTPKRGHAYSYPGFVEQKAFVTSVNRDRCLMAGMAACGPQDVLAN